IINSYNSQEIADGRADETLAQYAPNLSPTDRASLELSAATLKSIPAVSALQQQALTLRNAVSKDQGDRLQMALEWGYGTNINDPEFKDQYKELATSLFTQPEGVTYWRDPKTNKISKVILPRGGSRGSGNTGEITPVERMR